MSLELAASCRELEASLFAQTAELFTYRDSRGIQRVKADTMFPPKWEDTAEGQAAAVVERNKQERLDYLRDYYANPANENESPLSADADDEIAAMIDGACRAGDDATPFQQWLQSVVMQEAMESHRMNQATAKGGRMASRKKLSA